MPTFRPIALLLLSFSLLTGCSTTPTNYSERPQVQAFIDEMSTKHNFDKAQLTQLFEHVKPRPQLVKSMQGAKETSTPWYAYRAIFIQPARIQQGVDFWKQNATALNDASQRYGVPPQIIVAIIGVETFYGRHQGKSNTLNALATFAFDYPRRAPYFRGELEQYLLLTRTMSIDPLSVKGSYAGAMGQPQFMPSSYRTYAVDTSNKGYSDLFHNTDDSIYSVANYFKGHGWQTGGLVAMPARVTGTHYENLPPQTNKPELTVAELANYGIHPTQHLPSEHRASVLTLEGSNGVEHWLRFHNFLVITRYNTSPFYAMAVYQLSEAIKNNYQKQG